MVDNWFPSWCWNQLKWCILCWWNPYVLLKSTLFPGEILPPVLDVFLRTRRHQPLCGKDHHTGEAWQEIAAWRSLQNPCWLVFRGLYYQYICMYVYYMDIYIYIGDYHNPTWDMWRSRMNPSKWTDDMHFQLYTWKHVALKPQKQAFRTKEQKHTTRKQPFDDRWRAKKLANWFPIYGNWKIHHSNMMFPFKPSISRVSFPLKRILRWHLYWAFHEALVPW